MSKRRKKEIRDKQRARRAARKHGFQRQYEHAARLAEEGQYLQARQLYEVLEGKAPDARRRALVRSDLATLAAVRGDAEAARQGFAAALALDGDCAAARDNLALLGGTPTPAPRDPAVAAAPSAGVGVAHGPPPPGPVKVAILSFLFNWPSTGGGTVHTYELARFLAKAGYDVRHIYVRHAPWGIGGVAGPLPYPSAVLDFDAAGWNLPAIQERYRQAVDAFGPDYAIITDSWNMKPLLAEAVRGYPTILRFQALECFCPLNNVRLLPEPGGRFRQCPLHQFANPDLCARCVGERGHLSGSLHQAERALSGVGTPEYHQRLLRAVREAVAVLVVNPLHEAMLSPYSDRVRVVTAGMDPARFPWPWPDEPAPREGPPVRSIFFAGLVDEVMKGFHVVHQACALLRQRRHDFELVATGDPPGRVDDFTRFVGWLSQEELPRHLRAADMLVMPTIAQEALGRTAVEAMAVGRPVIASRLGGLPYTVAEGATGLLCEPGDAEDLARKIETLLDDADLRQRLGLAGRRRFEEHYAWDVIIERHYQPLLRRPQPATTGNGRPAPCSPTGAGGRASQPPPPLLQVVGPTDNWILERLARRLAAKLPYAAFVPWKPVPAAGARIAYYVNYALYQGPSGLIDAAFFTHFDEAGQFLERARRVDYCICMAKQYADWLVAQGVGRVAHVPMGLDWYAYQPQLVLGVVGRLDHPRKGGRLVERLR
jgi:glycosyltransferase involved in cell wall biosynthesis